jgi:hypothetical protein
LNCPLVGSIDPADSRIRPAGEVDVVVSVNRHETRISNRRPGLHAEPNCCCSHEHTLNSRRRASPAAQFAQSKTHD